MTLQATPPARGSDKARALAYFRYRIHRGCVERWGVNWKTPERVARLEMEREVIEDQGFESAFIMLAGIMDYAREAGIPYGPGRGSVGGSLVAYVMGIHEVDSLEYDLYFERFLNKARVSFPDVDLDFSQRGRDRILQFIRDTYQREGQIVLQVGAFTRAGGRAVIDLMLAAHGQDDPNAGATATNLKKCLPEANLTGGVKTTRELDWWLKHGHGDRDRFREIAEQAGWLDDMLKLDGVYTHLSKHAAGVVILREEDLPFIPQASQVTAKGARNWVTAYDMYALDDLRYLKWDILGLRTLDVLSDAHRFIGGSGHMRDLLSLWRKHRDDPAIYECLREGDSDWIFQMETPGYKRTLRDFQPNCFDHIVQLVALYRPGALDYKREEDGKNVVEVFIDRRHGYEPVRYDLDALKPILSGTYGLMIYQEQQMAVARALANFSMSEADELRRAIGKKKPKEMAKLMPLWERGILANKIEPAVGARWWKNLEKAARYSWNKAHAVEYGIIVMLCCYFKTHHTAAIAAAEINSWQDDKDRQANVIANARQHAQFMPPDVNVAEDRFIVDGGKIVFGLNGIKGMGAANRSQILVERAFGGPFRDFGDFCRRLPSVPISMKVALIGCGAFDSLGMERTTLLAQVTKPGPSGKRITVAEWINHYSKAKHPKPLPEDLFDYEFPTDTELAEREVQAMGYYITATPLRAVTEDLGRLPKSGICGGEVQAIRKHQDKNDNEMATLTITTPALTRARVRIFASNWEVWGYRVEKGKQLMFSGKQDGDSFLADKCWEPGDYRRFRKIKVWNGQALPVVRDFNGSASVVRELESSGHRVRLL